MHRPSRLSALPSTKKPHLSRPSGPCCSLNYPDFEVLVCNDGSTDGTLRTLKDVFNLEAVARVPMGDIPTAAVRGTYRSRRFPNLWVLDKENGGKADALNAGINFCRSALFCAMDADTLLERDALLRIVRPFMEDSRTVAAGGIIRIANGCSIRKRSGGGGGTTRGPPGAPSGAGVPAGVPFRTNGLGCH